MDVSNGQIDPSQAYVQRLPSGKSIALFFYDGVLSRGVAFEGLLHRGELFAARLAGAAANDRPRLSHIATDGESYGHHHAHGDMALAYALHAIESRGMAEVTNYGAFLERFPPDHEVEICENTAWSCAHGIERWRSDCGCHTGGPGGWNQSWRGPLRAALDQLRERALAVWEAEAPGLLREPSEALDHYIDVIFDRLLVGSLVGSLSANRRRLRRDACRSRESSTCAQASRDASPAPADVYELRLVLQ